MIFRFLLLSLYFSSLVHAAAKSPPIVPANNWVGKKVVALASVPEVQILMPDNSLHNFGEDFQASLTTQLVNSEKYLVIDAATLPPEFFKPAISPREAPIQYYWNSSEMPSVTVRVSVVSLTFQTGSKGDLMFYGFDERLNNFINEATGSPINEFPLRQGGEASWFGNSFDQKGLPPFDSQSGLDLGDGLSVDFLFAFLNLKYASYHSELHLRLELDSPLTGGALAGSDSHTYEMIEVKGDGYYFDIAGGYQGYSVGINYARNDAMSRALASAIRASYSAIDRSLSTAPWLAKVDGVLKNGLVLMGTGAMSNIAIGTLYGSVEYPSLVLQVVQSPTSGSVGKVIQGDPALLAKGMIFEEMNTLPKDANPLLAHRMGAFDTSQSALVPALVDTTQLPWNNLSAANVGSMVKLVSRFEAVLKSITGLIFLPYRLWRYFNYDQSYHARADSGGPSSHDLGQETWRHQIGLDRLGNLNGMLLSGSPPVVAIIDSGVDYNHGMLHDSLWLNPSPTSDSEGRKDRYGWDFISNDSKPYDDGYHGTQLAGLVAEVAPMAKIMPLKIFNPWGITSSAAVFGAFQYAVDHGAQIILCGWATIKINQALEQGVKYAKDHGVIVVAAAGDMGFSLTQFPVYPAVYSRNYDNVLTVTSVDFADRPVAQTGFRPNFDLSGTSIQIAAPGQTMWVAEPRGGKSVSTSTGLAAAVVAGVLARNIAFGNISQGSGAYENWISELLSEADIIPGLRGQVRGGARVKATR